MPSASLTPAVPWFIMYAVNGEAADAIRDTLNREWGMPVQEPARPLVGYFCTYTPLELLHAAGAYARRVFPPEPGAPRELDLHRVAAHLPGFVCPYMKRALEHALTGDAPAMAGLVHAYSCDVTCGVFNIWKELFHPEVAIMLHQPYRLNPASLDYYLAELRGCARVLEALTGRAVTDEGLREAAALYNRQRSYLRRLAAGLTDAPPLISATAFLELVLFCQLRPVEQANSLLERTMELAAGALDAAGHAERETPDIGRVLVSGSVLEDARALHLVEEAGGRVVAEDLCTGSRWYAEDIAADGDPWAALAERYMGRTPCPTRDSAAVRAQRLDTMIAASRAGSVLFLVQKFCDPHLADIPLLREHLAAKGVPSLLLELEDEGPATEQWKTRLETFFQLGREE